MVNRKLHGPDVPDRVRALALDIAHRLRPVCSNMPDEDMLELSTRMAAVELEYFEPAPLHRTRRRAAHGQPVMGEEWDLFEDAATSARRRRAELIARLRERVIAAGDKLSEEQVNAIVARMADTALEGERLRHGRFTAG